MRPSPLHWSLPLLLPWFLSFALLLFVLLLVLLPLLMLVLVLALLCPLLLIRLGLLPFRFLPPMLCLWQSLVSCSWCFLVLLLLSHLLLLRFVLLLWLYFLPWFFFRFLVIAHLVLAILLSACPMVL